MSVSSSNINPANSGRSHVRPLLSGESLEKNLGVAIDAKVVDSLRVRTRGVCPALDCSSVSKGRGRVPANSLHDDWRTEMRLKKKRECRVERRDCTARRAIKALRL